MLEDMSATSVSLFKESVYIKHMYFGVWANVSKVVAQKFKFIFIAIIISMTSELICNQAFDF